MHGTDNDQKLALATCFPKDIFKWERNSECSLVWVWPNSGWQDYFSLDILEEIGLQAEI